MSLRFNEKVHRYWLDGKPVKSVTGLTKALDKPAIPYWAAKTVAEYVADNLHDLDAWGRMERDSLVAALKQVPWSKRDQAAIRGTDIHNIAERVIHGEAVEVPEHLAPFVEGYVDFLDAFDVQPVLTETSVGNRRHGPYAGRLDFLGHVRALGDELYVLDWKTSNGVYGDTALQTAAYARAEFYTTDDDPNTEHPLPQATLIGVVHITEYGSFLHDLGDVNTAFDEFLHVAALTNTVDRRKALIGDPIPAPEVNTLV